MAVTQKAAEKSMTSVGGGRQANRQSTMTDKTQAERVRGRPQSSKYDSRGWSDEATHQSVGPGSTSATTRILEGMDCPLLTKTDYFRRQKGNPP